jgi:phage shock protein PspC (stress-responsive transcriptional regulator)
MSENTTRERPRLLRDPDRKMIAGVCTGLGRHLDMDPVVFRILFAVLTFFGGLGILAYAACWLLIPASGESDSEAQRLLTGPNVYVAAGAAALMVLGLLWFTDIVADRFDRSIPLVLVVAAVIGVVVWHRENRGNAAGFDSRRGAWGPEPGSDDPFAQAPTWWQRPVPDQPRPDQPQPFTAAPSGAAPSAAGPAAGERTDSAQADRGGEKPAAMDSAVISPEDDPQPGRIAETGSGTIADRVESEAGEHEPGGPSSEAE